MTSARMIGFLKKRTGLKPHEKAVLDALADGMSAPGDRLLRDQIAQIRHVQRFPGEPEVNFYAHRKGGGWDPTTLFRRRTEFVLGRLRLRCGATEHKSVVHAVNGHVFALVTRPAMDSRPGTAVTIEHVEAAQRDDYDSEKELPGASKNIPRSYLNYLSAEGPRRVNEWTVLDPDETYSVSPSVADMVVLAAGTEGRILAGNDDESFWIYDPAREAPTSLEARSFMTAIEEVAGIE